VPSESWGGSSGNAQGRLRRAAFRHVTFSHCRVLRVGCSVSARPANGCKLICARVQVICYGFKLFVHGFKLFVHCFKLISLFEEVIGRGCTFLRPELNIVGRGLVYKFFGMRFLQVLGGFLHTSAIQLKGFQITIDLEADVFWPISRPCFLGPFFSERYTHVTCRHGPLQYGQGFSIDYWKGSAAYIDDRSALETRRQGTTACAQHAASVTYVRQLMKYISIDQELRVLLELRVLPNAGEDGICVIL
jgi:hypothetical protein